MFIFSYIYICMLPREDLKPETPRPLQSCEYPNSKARSPQDSTPISPSLWKTYRFRV